jgi:hypothetical protein
MCPEYFQGGIPVNSLTIDLRRFSTKYDVPISAVKAFVKSELGKPAAERSVELNREEYRCLKDFFTEDSQMVALVFYNPGRDRTQLFKNVVKLLKTTGGSGTRYRYEWYRYVFMNGVVTRIKIGEIGLTDIERLRVWRNTFDKSVVVLLNEEGGFEALSRLPTSLKVYH